VVSVAPGITHTVALCSDGTVACWGSNDSGELGNNNAPTSSAIPVLVDTGVNSALHNKQVIAVAAGSYHSLALCSDGTVAGWGAGGYGQLGTTNQNDSHIPVAMYAGAGSALQNKQVVALAGGHYHTYLLLSDGTVAGCGHNFGGQIGTGSNSPTFVLYPVPIKATAGSALFGKTVVAIATGLYHGLALCTDGTIAGWGRDSEGELGDGTAPASIFTPVAVDQTTTLLAGKTVVGIAAGGEHSLALCSDGTLAAWGSNSAGQLGNGASGFDPVTAPVAVDLSGVLLGQKVVSLVAGSNNSFALCADGTLASWGDNTLSELGDGSSVTESHVPVLVDTAPLAAAGARFISLVSGPDSFHETAMVALPPAPRLVVLNGSGISGTQRSNNDSFSFADTSMGSNSSAQTFTIENAGSADLNGLVVAKTGTGNPDDFILGANGLPGTLASGASVSSP
jgi:alpha-tubulin suppressor-like RCC1 family protein